MNLQDTSTLKKTVKKSERLDFPIFAKCIQSWLFAPRSNLGCATWPGQSGRTASRTHPRSLCHPRQHPSLGPKVRNPHNVRIRCITEITFYRICKCTTSERSNLAGVEKKTVEEVQLDMEVLEIISCNCEQQTI